VIVKSSPSLPPTIPPSHRSMHQATLRLPLSNTHTRLPLLERGCTAGCMHATCMYVSLPLLMLLAAPVIACISLLQEEAGNRPAHQHRTCHPLESSRRGVAMSTQRSTTIYASRAQPWRTRTEC